MEFIKCVGALHLKEVGDIFLFHKTRENEYCFIIPTGFIREFPEKFPFGNNPEAMKKIKDEACSGPFQFLVIFYREI